MNMILLYEFGTSNFKEEAVPEPNLSFVTESDRGR